MGRIARLLPKIPKNRVSVLSTTLYGIGRKEKSLAEQVREILTKYSGTMLIPGPDGVLVESFQPGNYRESTGQTLASVDQQVGLVMDAAGAVGPELIPSGAGDGTSADGWIGSANATVAVAAGEFVITKTTTDAYPCMRRTLTGLIAGRTYQLQASFRNPSALDCFITFSGNSVQAARSTATAGILSARVTATGSTHLLDVGLWANSGSAGQSIYLDNVSVRELPGIHASQSTSGFQPYLRKVPKTLGPEMWANDYSGFTLGTGWSISGNKLVGTSVAVTQSAFKNVGLALGKSYVARYRISSLSSGTVRAIASSGVSGAVRSAVGDYEDVITPSAGSGNYGFIPFAAFTGEIEVLSIREVLEWTYAWQFDAIDDRLVASTVPFQPAENYFSVFGVVRNSDAVLRRVWEVQNVGIGGGMGVWLTNNTATFYASGATAVTTGVADGPVVITAKKLGNARSIQADNFAPVINTALVTDHTSLTCVIGNTIAGDRPYSGPIYAGILGKGAISDAEVQTLKRFIAYLQGRSL